MTYGSLAFSSRDIALTPTSLSPRGNVFARLFDAIGPGVYELVEDHRGEAYRAVYMVRIAGRVYVLHAFQKKSKSGIKTPQVEVELVETRLKAVLGRYRNERE